MKHSLLLVVLYLVALSSSALSKHYYIVPANSTDSACHDYQDGTCLTLRQLAQLNLTFIDRTNLTLRFLPGEHLLTKSLTIHNITHVQIDGTNESVVRFQVGKRIEVLQCEQLHIDGVAFVQLHKSMRLRPTDHWNQEQHVSINYVQSVQIKNCYFMSTDKQQREKNIGNSEYDQELNSGDQEIDSEHNQEMLSAVMIKNARHITLGNFIAKGNYGKVVYVESQCNVTISDSEFTGNVGDVVYIYTTNANISDSKFHSNIGRVLTIDSVSTFITQCTITNNSSPHSSVLHITPHSSQSKLTNSTMSDCSIPTFYSVVTSDTALHVGSKVYMDSSLLPVESSVIHDVTDSEDYNMNAEHPERMSYTIYHCIDFSDLLASDLRNLSEGNDIIYDFTTRNASSSHGNKGRFCVNSDHRSTVPFISRVVFSDDETRAVLTEVESDTSQDDLSTLTSERVSLACSKKSSSGKNVKKNSENSNRICDDTIHPTKDLLMTAGESSVYKVSNRNIETENQSAVIAFINNTSHFGRALSMQYHYIPESTSGNVLITSCFFTNNTSNYGGGAIAIRYSKSTRFFKNVFITSCSFTNNTSQRGGGAVFIYSHGNVFITSCSFTNNTCKTGSGGAIHLTTFNGNILITSSSFTNNTSRRLAGAVSILAGFSESTWYKNMLITYCSFTNNTSHGFGAVYMYSNSTSQNLLITSSLFTNNTSQRGGAVSIIIDSSTLTSGNVLITSCSFTNNTSEDEGGAILIQNFLSSKSIKENVLITFCSFTNNTSRDNGGAISIYSDNSESTSENVLVTSCSFTNNTSRRNGGAIFIYPDLSPQSSNFNGNVLVTSCSFVNNIGGAIYIRLDLKSHLHDLKLRIVSSKFEANSAQSVNIVRVNNATVEQSNFTDSEVPSFYLQKSTVTFLSDNLFKNNNGSVYAFSSELIFEGQTVFRNNYHSPPIHVVQSQIHFNSPEGTTIKDNTASFGGGIYLRESTMTVSHPIEISHNTADYGGGIYAYLSSINFISETVNKHVVITNNKASQSGGGICAVATIIEISRSYVKIDSNTASINGGGMYIEQGTRVNLLKHEYVYQFHDQIIFISISNNSAQYGGGIFVEDKTASGSLCDGSSVIDSNIKSIPSSECFFQFVRLYPFKFRDDMQYINTVMTDNIATISGDAVYGGLFDRCTISSQAEIEEFASNGLDYISKTIVFANSESFKFPPLHELLCDRNYEMEMKLDITKSCYSNKFLYSSISSRAVQVKFCKYGFSQFIFIRKGGSFEVHILAVDQVGNPVNATIHASVVTDSGVGRLKEGQTEQTVGSQCTKLEYSVFSQDSSAQLELYADGPCTNLGISKQIINITFLPCTCAIGLQPSHSKVDCVCDCDRRLLPYQITNCSQEAGTIKLETNIWIGVEQNSTNGTGYIIHDCPFDYCVEKIINIRLNSSQERDRQCAFNRSGILCGECQQGLSLVLATSKCKKCSNIYLLLLIPFTLAGIVLVVFILLFNLTIATGTIHGLIFYANVLAANKAIFSPFSTPNFLTVFISWVNLDLGTETCFYSQLNSQAKVLLQLVFPAYLFLLIFLIIVLSRYFTSFAKLLSIRNPVAALATLLFLSYSKLLRFVIAALQNTVLEYPNRHKERVWLYDANVPYFSPSHIPRFVAAAIILTAGGLFTVLLFFSQWLPRCSNCKLLKWTTNTKYTGFMDAYHAPFTPGKHRYWIGLLLFALIAHNTITAVATDTFLPVLSAHFIPVGLITLKLLSNRVYKIWLADALETLSLSNLIILAISTRGIKYRDQILASISMAIAFTLFVVIISYHFYKYILVKTSIWPKVTLLGDSLKNSFRLRQANQRQDMYQVIADNQMDDDELLEALDYNNEQPGIVDSLYTGGPEEEANLGQYHTPPRIIPATRPDQLREPDLDDLAPITTDDYRPAPLDPRPRANNYQGVTRTVIGPVAAV